MHSQVGTVFVVRSPFMRAAVNFVFDMLNSPANYRMVSDIEAARAYAANTLSAQFRSMGEYFQDMQQGINHPKLGRRNNPQAEQRMLAEMEWLALQTTSSVTAGAHHGPLTARLERFQRDTSLGALALAVGGSLCLVALARRRHPPVALRITRHAVHLPDRRVPLADLGDLSVFPDRLLLTDPDGRPLYDRFLAPADHDAVDEAHGAIDRARLQLDDGSDHEVPPALQRLRKASPPST